MLDELRRTAIDLARAEDWAGLLAVEKELRTDAVQWVNVWAPLLAVAARKLGRDSARSYLDEAIADGFFQPSIHEPGLSETFGSEPDWTELLSAMAAKTPAPPLELLAWPVVRPTAPLELFRSANEDELRARLPQRDRSAWETAKSVLSWATHAWVHTSNDHLLGADAVEILDEVATGRRFACKEFTVVLTQALNAVGIPARRAGLLNAAYHAGIGAGHEVSEAWIDDLGKWVLLDGQNGMYWISHDGSPLGVLELQQLHHSGGQAGVECLRTSFDRTELDLWWQYFAFCFVTGAMWPQNRIVPIFEGRAFSLPPMVSSPEHAYPDLSEFAIAFSPVDGRPAIQPHPAHPFATGYSVTDGQSTADYALDDAWSFPDRGLGMHEVRIATKTPYGTTKPATLTWKVT